MVGALAASPPDAAFRPALLRFAKQSVRGFRIRRPPLPRKAGAPLRRAGISKGCRGSPIRLRLVRIRMAQDLLVSD